MSRSFKKAVITISKKLRDNAYRVVRKRVKAKLVKINLEEIDGPDLCDIEVDTRTMGLEEYGTKMGMEFESLKENNQYEFNTEESQKEDLKAMRRK